VEAYAQLAAEGYLVAKRGAGSFVSAEPPPYEMEPGSAGRPASGPLVPGLSSRAGAVLREAAIDEGRAFAACVPDLSQLRFDIWHKLLTKCWQGARTSDTQYAAPGGHPRLRAAIAAHVTLTRQVRCKPEQVVIVNGAQHGLDLCARFFAEPGDVVWVENPGYPGARRVFGAAGLDMVPVPVDAEGLAPVERDWQRPPRLIYVTPSHQFPTGVEMSVERRRALLARAARHGCLIIEDDYDGEFRLGGRPIPSLQGMDEGERVLYVGTFSKVLFPALRLGYVVAPERTCEQFALAVARLMLEGRQVTQFALAAFIEQGHFAAHIRRMRVTYGERRRILEEIWQRELGSSAPLSGTQTGMHVITELPLHQDVRISRDAQAHNIVAQSLTSMTAGSAARGGLILGYGGAHDQEVRDRGTALARLIADAMR
jgi:GntR family transcriptional regulator/MocR family aminotransferase